MMIGYKCVFVCRFARVRILTHRPRLNHFCAHGRMFGWRSLAAFVLGRKFRLSARLNAVAMNQNVWTCVYGRVFVFYAHGAHHQIFIYTTYKTVRVTNRIFLFVAAMLLNRVHLDNDCMCMSVCLFGVVCVMCCWWLCDCRLECFFFFKCVQTTHNYSSWLWIWLRFSRLAINSRMAPPPFLPPKCPPTRIISLLVGRWRRLNSVYLCNSKWHLLDHVQSVFEYKSV